jgi:hypothetical protein
MTLKDKGVRRQYKGFGQSELLDWLKSKPFDFGRANELRPSLYVNRDRTYSFGVVFVVKFGLPGTEQMLGELSYPLSRQDRLARVLPPTLADSSLLPGASLSQIWIHTVPQSCSQSLRTARHSPVHPPQDHLPHSLSTVRLLLSVS